MKSIILSILLLVSSYVNPIAAQEQMEYVFHFESAESELSQAAQEAIRKIAQQATLWTEHNIIIRGHTDNVGAPPYNLMLSRARAKEVKGLFETAGINPKRILIKAVGEKIPLASNEYKEGRQQNRRVEIFLTTEKEINYESQQARNKLALEQIRAASPVFTVRQMTSEQYIETEKGAKIKIPAEAFDVPNGTVVEIEVTEAYKKSDMILQGLSTMSNGKQLVSGGMIKIDAFANGEMVALKEGKVLNVNLPSEKPDSRMELFYADESAKEMNWGQPQPLLVKQPFRVAPVVSANTNIGIFSDGRTSNYDERWYTGPTKLQPSQIMARRSKRYLDIVELKPLDYSSSLNKPEEPEAIDSSRLVFWQKELVKVNQEIKTPCKSFVCKFKAFFRSKKRKKAMKQEQLDRLTDIKRNIRVHKKSVQTQIKIYEEYLVSRARYLKEKEKCREDYLKQMEGWDDILLRIDSTNFEYACYNKDIGYLYSKYSTKEKEACQKMYAVNTFEAAMVAKKKEALVAYVNYFNPQRNKIGPTAIEVFIGDFSNKKEMDRALYDIAIEQRDTNYIRWRLGYKESKTALLAMYNVETIGEVRGLQREEHIDRRREYYKTKMVELGLNTVEEAYLWEENLNQKKDEWDSQVGYVFETAKLGNWINCDYFPGKTKERLITQNFELPVSPNATTTYLIFKDIASVMSGEAAYADMKNYYTFKNIPKGKPVQVLSFYMDVEGNTHVAIKNLKAKGVEAERLEYKTMSAEEFKATLLALDV